MRIRVTLAWFSETLVVGFAAACVAIVALWLLPIAGLAAQAAPLAPGQVMLRPGDALRVTVWQLPDMSGEYEIAPNGTLRHPVYNQVRIAGLPMDSVRARLVTFLRDYQREPLIDIAPLVRIAVLGEVRSPGTYLVPPESSPIDAVLKAGGATLQAKDRQVVVERDGVRRTVHFSDNDVNAEYLLVRSGDELYVPRRRSAFREIIQPIAILISAVASIYLIIQQYWLLQR